MKHAIGQLLRFFASEIDPKPQIAWGDVSMAQERYITAVNAMVCAQRHVALATRERNLAYEQAGV